MTQPMNIGVFIPIGNNGWLLSENAPQYMPSFALNKAFVARMARFVAASEKGWDYARAHPDEATSIVLENDASGAQTEPHQKRMIARSPSSSTAPTGPSRPPTTTARSRSCSRAAPTSR